MNTRSAQRTATAAISRARLPISSSSRFNSSSATTASSDPGPSSTPFSPALPQGQNPAYDAALSFLSSHRSKVQSRLERLRSSNASPSEVEHLEIASQVNDPQIRRAFRETGGKGQMGQAVMRHLAEKVWKKEGGLDLLMQRVRQLGVIPDLLPDLPVTSPLTIKVGNNDIEPGSIQLPSDWSAAPSAYLQLFHHPAGSEGQEEALYTLLVIDTDHPSPETQSFAQRVLYAKSDIPLSVHSCSTDLLTSPGQTLLEWEPPLPAQGSGKHRYVFIVLRQPSSSTSKPVVERSNFNLRSFLAETDTPTSSIVGISLIRSQWSKEQSTYIADKYREIQGGEIPVYGKPPKEMRFGYPLSASQKRAEEVRQEAWDRAVGGLQDGLGEVEVVKEDK